MTTIPLAYASTCDIQQVYGLTRSAIYTLASRRQWRRIRYGGRTLYHWQDVADSLTKPAEFARFRH